MNVYHNHPLFAPCLSALMISCCEYFLITVKLRFYEFYKKRRFPALAQNFFHCPAFRQLINQLVQISDLLHQRIHNLLHPDAADRSFDQCAPGIDAGRLLKKGLVIHVRLKLCRQPVRIIPCKPADHFVNFLFRPPFFLHFLYKQRIYL